MNERKDRNIPLIISTILYIVTTYIIFRFKVPFFLKSFFLAVAFLSLIATLINFWWKISLHSIGAGAILALVVILSIKMYTPLLWYLIPVIIAGGLILSSRLQLNLHNPGQVWSGFLDRDPRIFPYCAVIPAVHLVLFQGECSFVHLILPATVHMPWISESPSFNFICLQEENNPFDERYSARYSCSVCPGVGTSNALHLRLTSSIIVEYPALVIILSLEEITCCISGEERWLKKAKLSDLCNLISCARPSFKNYCNDFFIPEEF